MQKKLLPEEFKMQRKHLETVLSGTIHIVDISFGAYSIRNKDYMALHDTLRLSANMCVFELESY